MIKEKKRKKENNLVGFSYILDGYNRIQMVTMGIFLLLLLPMIGGVVDLGR